MQVPLRVGATTSQLETVRAVRARLQRALPSLPVCSLHEMSPTTDIDVDLSFNDTTPPLTILRDMHTAVLPSAIATLKVRVAQTSAADQHAQAVAILYVPFEWQPLCSRALIMSDDVHDGCWSNCLQLVDVLVSIVDANDHHGTIVLAQTPHAHTPPVWIHVLATGEMAAFGNVLTVLRRLLIKDGMGYAVPSFIDKDDRPPIPLTHWRSAAHRQAALQRACTTSSSSKIRSAYVQRALETIHGLDAPADSKATLDTIVVSTAAPDSLHIDKLAHWLPALQVIACAGCALGWWACPQWFQHAQRTTCTSIFGYGIDQLLCAMLQHDDHVRVLYALDGNVCGGHALAMPAVTMEHEALPPSCSQPQQARAIMVQPSTAEHKPQCLQHLVRSGTDDVHVQRAAQWCCRWTCPVASPRDNQTSSLFIIFGRPGCPYTEKAKAHCARIPHVFHSVSSANDARAHDAFAPLLARVTSHDAHAARAHTTVPLIFHSHNDDAHVSFVGGCDALLSTFPRIE